MEDINEEQVFAGIKSGASACLPKDIDPDYLVDIVRKVAAGSRPVVEELLTPGLASRVLAEFDSFTALGEPIKHLLARLSPGETELLRYIAAGSGLEQLTTRLHSDENTIRSQLDTIVDKLVANSQSVAVIKALEKGLPSIVTSVIEGSGLGREYLTKKEFTAFKDSLIQRLKPFIDEIALPNTGR